MWTRNEKAEIIEGLLDIIQKNSLDREAFGSLPEESLRNNSSLEKFVDKLAFELDKRTTNEANNILYSSREREGRDNSRKISRESRGIRGDSETRVCSDGSTNGDKGDDAFLKEDAGTSDEPNIYRRVSSALAPDGKPYHWARKGAYLKQLQNTLVNRRPTDGFDPQASFTIKRRRGSSVWAYYLDEKPDSQIEEFQLRLTTEPIIREFDGLNYEDVVIKQEYNPDDPLESKGRISAPINLDAFSDIKLDDELTAIGCDPARYGTDSTIILIRQGIHVVDVQRFSKQDTMQSTGYLVQAIKEWKPSYVNIETVGGLGAGMYDRLQELRIDEVTNLCGIETQSQTVRHERLKCFNVRTEMFVLLQERFRAGLITLPPNDEELAEEVVNVKYKLLSDGRLMIIENEQIRKNIGRSPDRAISLALAFYAPQITGIYN